METIIKKWGNSLGVRIPNLIAKELSLTDGSIVEIENSGNEIIIKQKNDLLAEMLNLINKDNIHEEIELSSPVGKEIW
jgi:antitoxin MazE